MAAVGTCPHAREPQSRGSSAERIPCRQCCSSCKRQPTRLRGPNLPEAGTPVLHSWRRAGQPRALLGAVGRPCSSYCHQPSCSSLSPGSLILPPALLCLLAFVRYMLPARNGVRFLGGLQSTANDSPSQSSSPIKPTDGRKRMLGGFFSLLLCCSAGGTLTELRER